MSTPVLCNLCGTPKDPLDPFGACEKCGATQVQIGQIPDSAVHQRVLTAEELERSVITLALIAPIVEDAMGTVLKAVEWLVEDRCKSLQLSDARMRINFNALVERVRVLEEVILYGKKGGKK